MICGRFGFFRPECHRLRGRGIASLRLSPKTMKLILSCDGGGIRGVFTARVLMELEKVTGQRLCRVFDLIAGTSTGGILACGLAVGLSAEELFDLYSRRGNEIFSSKEPLDIGWSMIAPRYSPAPLESILREILGDQTLDDVKTALLVTSYAIELPASQRPLAAPGSTRAPYFFKSSTGPNAFLHDVARATSAAPTYFPPHQFTNLMGEAGAYVDGGVVANNPAMCALAESLCRWPGESIAVISVGTGELEQPIPYNDAKGWGMIGWARPILSLLMDGSCDTVTYQLDQVLGQHHVRIDTSLGTSRDSWAASDAMDDASPQNVSRLCALAEKTIKGAQGASVIARINGFLKERKPANQFSYGDR
jgi:uncharacterized protein